jgi:hypothetical protein
MLVDPRLQQCVDCCSQLSTVRYMAFSLFCKVGGKMKKVQRREMMMRRVMDICWWTPGCSSASTVAHNSPLSGIWHFLFSV